MDIQKLSIAKLNPSAYNPRKDLKPGDLSVAINGTRYWWHSERVM
jgi:hypothetical protein